MRPRWPYAALVVFFALCGCESGFSFGGASGPTDSPFAELEAAKLETVHQFLRLETGDPKIARGLTDQLGAERKLVLESARVAKPALALAASVKDGRAVGSGAFSAGVTAGRVYWLFPADCSITQSIVRTSAGSAQIVVVGLGAQDVKRLSSLLDNRIDLLQLELRAGETATVVGAPLPGPGLAIIATQAIRLSGDCR
ncbi:MAG: hypothetical protein EXQ91_03000 [Alphaproteobacteria bacterium]|nr:hypothetical protein [Alphaproteobacteria bacterium]